MPISKWQESADLSEKASLSNSFACPLLGVVHDLTGHFCFLLAKDQTLILCVETARSLFIYHYVLAILRLCFDKSTDNINFHSDQNNISNAS